MAEVARRLGKPLMPWQRHAVDVALELDPETGELWYEEVIITVPRQSGKTTLILAILVWRCITMALRLGSQTCTYLAQTGKMARRKLEREFARIMRRARSLREIPKSSRQIPTKPNEWKLSMNNGSEHIAFGTGSYLQIDSPTEEGSHGDVLDMPVIDEAFSHEDDLVEQAVDAATVTRRSPQSFIVSTAGNEKSRFLARKVIAGRKSVDDPLSRTCYLEWSVPEDEQRWDDPEVWWRYLPALGHTITVERLLARLDKAQRNPDEVDEEGFEPGVAGFKRGYLNIWPKWPKFGEDEAIGIIDWHGWEACQTKSSEVASHRAEALAVSADRRVGWFAVAGRRTDGRIHVEVGPVPMRKVVDTAEERWVARGVSLRTRQRWPEIIERGVDLFEVSSKDYAAGVNMLIAAVEGRQLAHIGQRSLDAAVKVAQLSNAGVWSAAGADVAPLEAATLALSGVPDLSDDDDWNPESYSW